MKYNEAIEYLNSFVNYEELTSYDYKTSFKLERMQILSNLLGNPHKDVKAVHVTGTKGKGSTAAITASVLKAANMRTGLYTSPHLVSFRERIKIDGRDIKRSEVSELVEEVAQAVKVSGRKDYTFFELYTALAFLYFKKKKADIAVIEVGLGGRLDATNIVEPLVSCITPVSLDHTHLLGPTLEDIAREKAAIIKKGSICISAPQPNEVSRIIERRCREKGVKLNVVGKDILFKRRHSAPEKEIFSIFGVFEEYPELEMKLLGGHQVMNAAAAIGIIEALRYHDTIIPVETVRKGLGEVEWSARLEVASRDPMIVFDGAQNKESIVALKEAIRDKFTFKKLILVLGASKDKDIPGVCKELDGVADEIILTKADNIRAEDPSAIKEYTHKDARITNNVGEAMDLSKKIAEKDDLILITGSFFVIGEAKEIIQR